MPCKEISWATPYLVKESNDLYSRRNPSGCVCLETADDHIELFARVQMELGRHRRDVHIDGGDLLLHHRLERRQRQRLRLLHS